ncbi:YdeI/OmpD-associated family protein [Candidatus Saccharibacteria bacterium]|nr:YdeI/OmpD-associated family protein [Candidatus Saccharibacteria bacterium]
MKDLSSPKTLKNGVVHTLPSDMRIALASQSHEKIWQNLTPLARNEWICWIESAKRPQTRTRRIERMGSELNAGMRRPCCWGGCGHRKADSNQ